MSTLGVIFSFDYEMMRRFMEQLHSLELARASIISSAV